MGLYDPKLLAWLKREWPKHMAAKLDLGMCCVRFRKVDEIPHALIGELAKKMTPRQWIEAYEASKTR